MSVIDDDLIKAWVKSQNSLIVLSICFAVSLGLNIWQFQKGRTLRFYYESSMIAWVVQAGGAKTAQELDALVRVVRKSKPRRLFGQDEMVDFGFAKDSSGTWKVTNQ